MSTEISNMALALLGSGVTVKWLTNFETDRTITAQWCRKLYPEARRNALILHEWNEATKTIEGVDAGADVSGVHHLGYDYAYLIPQEPPCLKFLRITNEDGVTLKHKTQEGYIYTDYETDEFYYHYIFDLDDETKFSASLRLAIAYQLAALLAAPIIKGKDGHERRRGLLQEYDSLILPNAIIADLDEEFDEINENAPEQWGDIT